MSQRKPLIRLGQGSYRRDLLPPQLSQPLDLRYLLVFAAGLAFGWILFH